MGFCSATIARCHQKNILKTDIYHRTKHNMKKQEPVLEVVSKKEEMEVRREQLQGMVDRLTAKIEKTEKELSEKLYVIEGKQDTADRIIDFLKHRAEWKFTESLGVLECIKQIEDSRQKLKDGKIKELMTQSLALEAIYYFMTKVTGMGVAEAKVYYTNMLKPVSEGLSRVKADKDKLDQLIRDLGTIEHAIDQGVSIENEDTFVKEIMGELDEQLS